MSFDSCCQALDSTYHVVVGRADDVTGPYVDRDGTPLLNGGGTIVLAADDDVHIGPGGQSVSDDTLAVHCYDRRLDGAFQLALCVAGVGCRGLATATW